MSEPFEPGGFRGADVPLECVSDGNGYDPRRERVRELRMRGIECPDIARQTGIPAGEVIVYCLQLGFPVTGPCGRLRLSPEDEAWLRYRRGEPRGRKCPVCGRILHQPSRGRKKKFCSAECRDKFWNGKWREKAAIHGREAVCENCGKVFFAINEGKAQRRYCSRECYFDARYGRKGDEDNGDEDHRGVPDQQYRQHLCTCD